MCRIQIMSKHEYKTIWINYNPTHLIKQVKPLTLTANFVSSLCRICKACKKLSALKNYSFRRKLLPELGDPNKRVSYLGKALF
jgi:hypothetical protein